MDKLNHIKQVLNENKSELREKFGIVELGIFGSYVRGEQETNSDLDLLVTAPLGHYAKSLLAEMGIESESILNSRCTHDVKAHTIDEAQVSP